MSLLRELMEQERNAEQLAQQLSGRTNLERYKQGMDSSQGPKFDVAKDVVYEVLENPNAVIVSIGAGTGVLERNLAMLGARVVAVDLSLPMLETIQGEESKLQQSQAAGQADENGRLWAVSADALSLPFAPKSVDILLCFSVLHEVASFACGYDKEKFKLVFQQLCQVLKPGGKLVIRDFVQPANPNEQVKVRVGTPEAQQFTEYFLENFPGADMKKYQVSEGFLQLPAALAVELIAHFSWRQSPEEINERYAYFSLEEYGTMIVEQMAEVGLAVRVVKSDAIAQAGYDLNTRGQLDLVDEFNDRVPLPAWTGSLVIERLAE